MATWPVPSRNEKRRSPPKRPPKLLPIKSRGQRRPRATRSSQRRKARRGKTRSPCRRALPVWDIPSRPPRMRRDVCPQCFHLSFLLPFCRGAGSTGLITNKRPNPAHSCIRIRRDGDSPLTVSMCFVFSLRFFLYFSLRLLSYAVPTCVCYGVLFVCLVCFPSFLASIVTVLAF